MPDRVWPEPRSLRLWTPCFPGHQETTAPSSHQGHRTEHTAGVDWVASGAMAKWQRASQGLRHPHELMKQIHYTPVTHVSGSLCQR